MKALENRADVRATTAHWRKAFKDGARVVGSLAGREVLWHERLGIWGVFGKTRGRGGIERDWNAFGQRPYTFRRNMIVEINPPPDGADQNLQGVFAVDDDGDHWVLHQGRLSASMSNVTEDDFTRATGLIPIEVQFSDGSRGEYHKVARLDAPPAVVQESVAEFVIQCAKARLAKTAPPTVLAALCHMQDWERGLRPEATGDFEVSARGVVKGCRWHGDVWRALSSELVRRKIAHSNDRIDQYGPDIFTYKGANVLFEIKTNAASHDVFEGVGQLQIYGQLLNAHFRTGSYRKVLVIPLGARAALEKPLARLKISVVAYRRRGRTITFDQKALGEVLK